jgi:ABC-type branched-subunit amino acid transport system ATPase component
LSLLTVLENMKLGAKDQVGEKLWQSIFPFLWKGKEEEIEQKALELTGAFQAHQAEGRLRGQPFWWAAQAPGDGPCADVRSHIW